MIGGAAAADVAGAGRDRQIDFTHEIHVRRCIVGFTKVVGFFHVVVLLMIVFILPLEFCWEAGECLAPSSLDSAVPIPFGRLLQCNTMQAAGLRMA